MTDDSKEKPEPSAVAAVLQSFYTELVLRDLFGKAAPGVLILLSVAVPLTSFKEVLSAAASATLGVWLLVIGLAWLAGLAVQGVGEFLWIRYFPPRLDLSTWQADLIAFRNAATPKDERQFERFTVVTEACGNGSVALFLSTLLVLSLKCCHFAGVQWGTALVAVISVALGLLGLIKMHFENVERRYGDIEKVLGRTIQPPNKPLQPTGGAATQGGRTGRDSARD